MTNEMFLKTDGEKWVPWKDAEINVLKLDFALTVTLPWPYSDVCFQIKLWLKLGAGTRKEIGLTGVVWREGNKTPKQ